MSDAEFARVEGEILARLREIRERREGDGGGLQLSQLGDDDVKVTGIEADFTADEVHEEPARGREVTVTRKPKRSRGKGRR